MAVKGGSRRDGGKAAGSSAAPDNISTISDGGASGRVPRHIAVIPDGNRRWARKRHLPAAAGHKAGVEAYKQLLSNAADRGVKAVTFYAFSTENWKRSQDEVSALMKLLLDNLVNSDRILGKNREKIRFLIAGDRTGLDGKLVEAIEALEAKTAGNTELIAVICLNYGGRDEIVRAARKLGEQIADGTLRPEDIDEAALTAGLYVNVPDPDLIIRTSGEQRLSNFLLWQAAYSELYFADVLWPDFDAAELDKALSAYAMRQRRYGG
ncbi:MAG: di-trans,poly-cis-decaprenylcistransferase [Clostridia bacterium]|nr:di-trans,poly-cis-decaprenylcistransferase [Clostridia bacterium]